MNQVAAVRGIPRSEDLPVSIAIPLYNEEAIVLEQLEKMAQVFDRLLGPENWLFILVENGSTDSTLEKAKVAVSRWPLSHIVSLPKPNIGVAFKAGLQAAATKWIYQLEIEQWEAPFIAWAWKNRNSYDLLMGSKRADPTINHQEPYRKLLSCGLNAMLQLFFYFTGTDTHGPKLINREALRDIIDICQLDRGQFDSELVLRAARSRKRIVEVPILYRDIRPHRNWMVKKVVWNCLALIRMFKVMKAVPHEGHIMYDRFGRDDVLAAGEELLSETRTYDFA